MLLIHAEEIDVCCWRVVPSYLCCRWWRLGVGLPYASVVSEMAEDGSPIYGIEIDVPCVGAIVPYGSYFFLVTS